MMRKRSYRELKARGHYFPLSIWLSDLLIPLLIVSMVAIILLGANSVLSTARKIQEPYTPDTPYQNISATPPPSLQWATSMVKAAPIPSINEWRGSTTSTPMQPVEFKDCSSFGVLSAPVTSTAKGSGGGVTLVAQSVLPGQGIKALDYYNGLYSKCWRVAKEVVDNQEIRSYDGGFFLLMGDALVFSSHPKGYAKAAELKSAIIERIRRTLKDSGCASTVIVPSDSERNLFVDAKKYTGKISSTVVNTRYSLDNIPQPVVQKINQPTVMEEPEGPISDSLPKLPKETPKTPQVPQDPNLSKPLTQLVASYQVPDPVGPACGWAWSGLQAPVTDAKALKAIEEGKIAATQKIVDSNATKFINDKLSFARQVMETMVQVNSWNGYVHQVDLVHEKWEWLKEQRDAIITDWYNYVEAHNRWVNFDQLKANAVSRYNAKVNACNLENKKLTDWETRWGALWERRRQELSQPPTIKIVPIPQAGGGGAPTPIAPTPTVEAPVAPPAPAPASTTDPAPETAPTPTVTIPSQQYSTITIPPTTAVTEDIPERPQGCGVTPTPEDIVGQDKGAEPQPPAMEEGVTVPNSWPKPISAPNVGPEQ